MLTSTRLLKIILFSFIAVTALSMNVFSMNVLAEEITDINSLIEDARKYDGQQVTVRGEAIGEVLVRGDYAWINIHDGTNAIGVWMTGEEASKVTTYGNYKHKGDYLVVSGIFNRADPEHGGEADLHSISLAVSEKGFSVPEVVSPVKLLSAAVLTLSALIFAGLFLRHRFQTEGV